MPAPIPEDLEEIAKKLPESADGARSDLKDLKVELAHLTRSFKV